ncbi:MAG: ComF family protein [Treponema sp.]|jgi:ComF family protein|nr:ComF family protein [Treponema sp.]
MNTKAGRIRRALFFLREYFFPCGCAICGKSLVNTRETWYGLCAACRAEIDNNLNERLSANAPCDLCGKPLISEQGRCLNCRNGDERSFDRVFVLFPYNGKHQKLLEAYKFGKSLALGNFFMEKIRDTFEKIVAVYMPEAVIVPVPPRPGKIKKTGWDQVEYLTKLLEGGLPVRRCLKRLRSDVQKKLNREDRRKNLKGRIILVEKAPAASVLIDDVMTTGSTLDVCASVLKAGGAERVYGICLFYD